MRLGVNLPSRKAVAFLMNNMCSMTMAPTETGSTPHAKPAPMITAAGTQIPNLRRWLEGAFWFDRLVNDMVSIPWSGETHMWGRA
jgi:hypothetical protein